MILLSLIYTMIDMLRKQSFKSVWVFIIAAA